MVNQWFEMHPKKQHRQAAAKIVKKNKQAPAFFSE
jgi:hypothetical protein